MAARRSDRAPWRQWVIWRHSRRRALPAPATERLRLIGGLHGAIRSHPVADLLLVFLLSRALPGESEELAPRLVRRGR